MQPSGVGMAHGRKSHNNGGCINRSNSHNPTSNATMANQHISNPPLIPLHGGGQGRTSTGSGLDVSNFSTCEGVIPQGPSSLFPFNRQRNGAGANGSINGAAQQPGTSSASSFNNVPINIDDEDLLMDVQEANPVGNQNVGSPSSSGSGASLSDEDQPHQQQRGFQRRENQNNLDGEDFPEEIA